MRTCRRGLPLLIVAAWLTASPADAADESDVGIVDDIVVVRAEELRPGERGGGTSDCVYEAVISDDHRLPIYDELGTRLYSDTGRWLQKVCAGESTPVGGYFTFPEGPGYSLPDMLSQAIAALDPETPRWNSSPDGVDIAMVTQLSTELWIEPGYWQGDFVVRAESPSGRVWAEARAIPAAVTWRPGDGAVVACDGRLCGHTFRRSTAGSAGAAMTVTVTFDIEGRTSEGGAPWFVGQLSRSSVPVVVTVGEIQAIETADQ